jgi:hypothetical protein
MSAGSGSDREKLIKQIFDRVRPTMHTFMSLRRGDGVEGTIARDDFDMLIALARNPGGPIPPSVVAIMSRKAIG